MLGRHPSPSLGPLCFSSRSSLFSPSPPLSSLAPAVGLLGPPSVMRHHSNGRRHPRGGARLLCAHTMTEGLRGSRRRKHRPKRFPQTAMHCTRRRAVFEPRVGQCNSYFGQMPRQSSLRTLRWAGAGGGPIARERRLLCS